MPLILYIDTSLDFASVFIAKNEIILAIECNENPKVHSAFIHLAIETVLKSTSITLSQIDAVAIINGPGSYTGTRVGLATAKGVCFALDKPLIVLNSLEAIALKAVLYLRSNCVESSNTLFCPMIDARRMEVFTALYNNELFPILTPQALIINEHTFSNELEQSKIYFCGNGNFKVRSVINHLNASFMEDLNSGYHQSMIILAKKSFSCNNFEDLNYITPFYLKNVFMNSNRKVL